MFVGINNLAERDKSELDKSLESVADADHKSVTSVKKLSNSLLYCGIAEERRDKFTRSVRLVAARESAGNKDYL